MPKIWNDVDFVDWSRGDVSVSVNEFGAGPIVLELEGDGWETYDLSEWMTPDEAREIAAKLLEAADATDRAGLITKGAPHR